MPIDTTPKTGAERARAWRQAHRVVRLDVSGDLAERVREARDSRGLTTEQLVALAVTSLEKPGDEVHDFPEHRL